VASFTRNQMGEIRQGSLKTGQSSRAPTLWEANLKTNALNQYNGGWNNAFTYDRNGNLTGEGTWTYTYDLDNRLKTAGRWRGIAEATLDYDPEGRLVRYNYPGRDRRQLYDGQHLAAEYDEAGVMLNRYVFGPGVDAPLVQYEGAGTNGKSYLYADQQGSIVATANAAGAVTESVKYGPFGETPGGNKLLSNFLYTGQYYLWGLDRYYYKARIYWPDLGRFQQTDPAGYQDDLNWYAYVGNNPINFTDPNGESPVSDVVKTIIKTFAPGPHAGEGVAATGAKVALAERKALAMQGDPCHICGAENFGTKTGLPVGDHIPPTSLAGSNESQRLYSSCLTCSNAQGGVLSAISKAKNTAVGVASAVASTITNAATAMWSDAKNDPVGFILWPVTSNSLGDGTLSGRKSASGF
jgi:RHS repeat-associated protein